MQGEAEAAKLIASAVQNNPGFVELREIQYAKDVATTIANSNFKVRIPSERHLSAHASKCTIFRNLAKPCGILFTDLPCFPF